MNTIIKSIILSTLSATLLTGCLDNSNNDRTDTILGEDGITGGQGSQGPIVGEGGETGGEGPQGPIVGEGGETGGEGPQGPIVGEGGETGGEGPQGPIVGEGGETGGEGPQGPIVGEGGETGGKGPQGPIVGENGETGGEGPQDPIVGEGGETGGEGPQGPIVGEGGETGGKGPQGPIVGEGGETGGEGPQGPIVGEGGETGGEGPQGPIVGEGGETGGKGPQGPIVGEGGETGGEGPQGPIVGEDGETGEEGPQGPTMGDTGEEGPQGPIVGEDGDTGEEGHHGFVGCKPDTSTPSINLFRLYDDSQCSDTRFRLAIADESGELDVPHITGEQQLLNIQTEPAGEWAREAAVKVSVNGDSPASILMKSDEAVDLTIPSTGVGNNQKGIIRFFVNPLTSLNENNRVVLSLPSSDPAMNEGQPFAEVDLTSAFYSYRGLGLPQEVKVPTACFIDAGVDFSEMTQPFSLVSESGIQFELSQIAVRGNAAQQAHVLECDTDSILLPAKKSTVLKFTPDGDNKLIVDGWATRRRSTDTISHVLTEETDPFQGQKVIFLNKKARSGSVRLMRPNNNKNRDISRLVENGVLQFDLYVTSFGGKDTRDFKITMESEDFRDQPIISESVYLTGISKGEVNTVTIPLIDLMTRYSNGQGYRIDVELIRHITSALKIELNADPDDKTDILDGVEFIINNVYLDQTDKQPGS